jgi:catechol 2,3-dioxygenase-like lactoylglutathione lyase family enzyme
MSRGSAGPGLIRGVVETCLYAEDLPETARFYEQVLGLEVLSRAEGRHVFFRSGGGVFLLFDPRRTAVRGGDVPPHGASGPGHVAFAVPASELSAWRPYLEANGVEIEGEVSWPRGGSSIYIRDPAGNSVELTSPTIWGISEAESFGYASQEA